MKMGTQTWHEECSEEKRVKHIAQDKKFFITKPCITRQGALLLPMAFVSVV